MKNLQLQDDYNTALDLLGTLYEIPAGYTLEYAHEVNLDRRPLWWLRFEREDGNNKGLEGEHFSALIDLYNQRLMGLTYLNHQSRLDQSPTEEKSSQLALEFIAQYAPDISPTLSVKWVQMLSEVAKKPPHDSALYFIDSASGSKHTILGTRVKMVDSASGLYSWVVVSDGGEILNFERDINWSTLRGRRTTEVWLHDAYPSHPGRKVIPTDSAKLMATLKD